MILTNFSRIEGAVDIQLIQDTHVVAVGAGGAYCLYDSLVRSGIGKLTVLDFDSVDDTNIVRQGYEAHQIGQKKVDALGEHLKRVNEGTEYTGITKNFLNMHQDELDAIFGEGDIFLFLTDSFRAQRFGNILALHYGKPAIWGGFYEKSRCAEMVFTIPGVTPACFRCAVSSRFAAQDAAEEEITVSSGCNTIFHSQLLDSYIGMLVFAILHNQILGFEFSGWFGDKWDRNLIQMKVHPDYSNNENNLFQRVFAPTEGRAFNFNAIWQKIEEECPPTYPYCRDCAGTGNLLNSKGKQFPELPPF